MTQLQLNHPHMNLLILMLMVPVAWPQCPDPSSIAPCACEGSAAVARQVSCRGAVGLPRLTAILRHEMCGRTIGKVEIIDSDITYLPSNLFIKNVVKDIQVSFTSISHFTRAGRSAFFGLERHLASLSMRRCRLSDSLQWQMIGELQVLSYLDLSYNNLSGVPRQWFRKPPPNLLSLILKGNRIASLESGSLSHMYKLIELDLSENQITALKRDVFPHPGNTLLFLRINDNILESLPDDFFDEMWGLKRIYMDNNQLQTLPERLWTPIWGDLEHLNLDGNPVECGCDLLWIAKLRPARQLYGECYFNANSTLANNTGILYNDTWEHPNNIKVVSDNNGVKLRVLEINNFELCEL